MCFVLNRFYIYMILICEYLNTFFNPTQSLYRARDAELIDFFQNAPIGEEEYQFLEVLLQ